MAQRENERYDQGRVIVLEIAKIWPAFGGLFFVGALFIARMNFKKMLGPLPQEYQKKGMGIFPNFFYLCEVEFLIN